MEKNHNEEMAAGVGQDKSCHDVVHEYDGKHGTYVDQKPAVGASRPHDQIPAPFGGLTTGK